MAEAEVLHAFEMADTGKDGKINRKEFIAGAEDFLFGVEETELSKIFFGPLLGDKLKPRGQREIIVQLV